MSDNLIALFWAGLILSFIGLALLAALKFAEWDYNRAEKEYKEIIEEMKRNNNFKVEISDLPDDLSMINVHTFPDQRIAKAMDQIVGVLFDISPPIHTATALGILDLCKIQIIEQQRESAEG